MLSPRDNCLTPLLACSEVNPSEKKEHPMKDVVLTVGAPAKSRRLEKAFSELMEVISAAGSHGRYFPPSVSVGSNLHIASKPPVSHPARFTCFQLEY